MLYKFLFLCFSILTTSLSALSYDVIPISGNQSYDDQSFLLQNGNIILKEDCHLSFWSKKEGKKIIHLDECIDHLLKVSSEGYVLGKYYNEDLFFYSPNEGTVNLTEKAMERPEIQEIIQAIMEEYKNDFPEDDCDENGRCSGVIDRPEFDSVFINNKGQVAGKVEDFIFFYDNKNKFRFIDPNELDQNIKSYQLLTLSDKGELLVGTKQNKSSKIQFHILHNNMKRQKIETIGLSQYLKTVSGKKVAFSLENIQEAHISDSGVIYGVVDTEKQFWTIFPNMFNSGPYPDWELTQSVFAIYPNGEVYLSGFTEYFEKKTSHRIDTVDEPPLFYSRDPFINDSNQLVFGSYSLLFFKLNENREIETQTRIPQELISFEEDYPVFPNLYTFAIGAQNNIKAICRIDEFMNFNLFFWDEHEGAQKVFDLLSSEWQRKLIELEIELSAPQINERGDILIQFDEGTLLLHPIDREDDPDLRD